MPVTTESRGRLGRLAWFFAIAAVSALAVAVVAEGLRFLILH
jgi:hypothetical protein